MLDDELTEKRESFGDGAEMKRMKNERKDWTFLCYSAAISPGELILLFNFEMKRIRATKNSHFNINDAC